jgi:hypothetical protein
MTILVTNSFSWNDMLQRYVPYAIVNTIIFIKKREVNTRDKMKISHIKKTHWKNQLGVAMATNLHATINRHGSLSSFYSLCSHHYGLECFEWNVWTRDKECLFGLHVI